jgi:hypothetical protein
LLSSCCVSFGFGFTSCVWGGSFEGSFVVLGNPWGIFEIIVLNAFSKSGLFFSGFGFSYGFLLRERKGLR